MKKLVLICFLIFSTLVVFANDITKQDLIGKDKRLAIPNTYLLIEFRDEQTYTFCSPYGGYLWKDYPYTLINNILTLENNGEKLFVDEESNELIFPNGQNAVFTYDANFNDFYCKGVFINDQLILRPDNEETPVGSECILDGIKVIKHSPNNSYLVAIENLKLRLAPSLTAPTSQYNYTNHFCPYPLEKIRHPIRAYSSYSEYAITEKQLLPLLLTGLVVEFDAVTVEKQTIDGITAPWYRVILRDDGEDGENPYFWVFGGYIKKVPDLDNPEYEKLFIKTAIEKGILTK